MTEDQTKPKSLLDSFFDAAEDFVGVAENLSGYKEGVWKVEEVIDSDTGEELFEVTDRLRTFTTKNKEHADWLVRVLSTGVVTEVKK